MKFCLKPSLSDAKLYILGALGARSIGWRPSNRVGCCVARRNVRKKSGLGTLLNPLLDLELPRFLERFEGLVWCKLLLVDG